MNYPFIRPSYYFSLLKEISSFVKSPTLDANLEKTTRMKTYDTLGLFILKMAFLVILGMLMLALSPIADPENLTRSSMSERFSPVMLLLVGGLLLPLVEEVCLRLSLRFKPIYLALTICTLTYYILTKAIFHTSVSLVDESFPVRSGLALLVGALSFPLLNTHSLRIRLQSIWASQFRYFYYFSCLAFAWIHIFNYELTLVNLLFLPLITMPQLLSAIVNGYTRIAFGFKYPLLFHFANNIIAISISFLPFEDLFLI